MIENAHSHVSEAEMKRPRINLGEYKDTIVPSDPVSYTHLTLPTT